MKLGKGIIQVIYANIINLIISLGNGFLVPKYLSVESYADIKTFLMYISYIGILHFGYIDGVYIKYGGKKLSEIDSNEWTHDRKALIIFQLGVSLPIVIIAYFFRDWILFLAAISVLPSNMVVFYKFIYQATGDFKEYRYIANLTSFLVFIWDMIFLFGLKTDNSLCYISIQVAVFFIVWFFYENKNVTTNVKSKIPKKRMETYIKENIRSGIIIMLGNFMSIWITSLDRWFIKFFCGIAEFAYYSFAVTTLKMINVVATAFSITLYNFFCKELKQEEVCKLRKIVLIIGAALITGIYPLDFLLYVYLDKYLIALPVIRLLFATQFIMIAINSVYLNLYKALNVQRVYLMRMIAITVVAFMLNAVIGKLGDYQITTYALATLITSFIWLALCQIDFPNYKMERKEWIYILLILAGYFGCSNFSRWMGAGVYVCWGVLVTRLLFTQETKLIFNMLLEVKNIKKRIC